MTKKLLSKEDILKADDRKIVEVDVPEWGGSVRVSQINAAARCGLTMMMLGKDGKPLPAIELNRVLTLGLVAAAVVDENGEQLFTEADIEALGKKSAVALDKVFAAADKLNGISAAMQEDLRKN